MADFREAIQERIGSMSPDELAATEARRLQREASNNGRLVLEARWDPAPGAPARDPITKAVTIEIKQPATPGGDGILQVFEGPAFKETILLTPAVYRRIAGGKALDGSVDDRFFVVSDGPEKVSVDRSALAVFLSDIHPAEMNRAARLMAAEPRGPVKSAEALQKLAGIFTRDWAKEIIHEAVDRLVSKVPSRTLHLIAGKDHVSLTVRKEELLVGEDGMFKSPLAAAIVPPGVPPVRPAILIAGDAAAFRDRDAPFLKNTYGTGPVRRLVLDVVKLKDLAAGLAPEPREAALALLSQLIERAAVLNRELPPRRPVPVHPVAPPRLVRRAPPPPAPVVEDELAMISPELDDIAAGDGIETGPGEDDEVPLVAALDEDAAVAEDEPELENAGDSAIEAGLIDDSSASEPDAIEEEERDGPPDEGEQAASLSLDTREEDADTTAAEPPPAMETDEDGDAETVTEAGDPDMEPPGLVLEAQEPESLEEPPVGEIEEIEV